MVTLLVLAVIGVFLFETVAGGFLDDIQGLTKKKDNK